MIGRIHRAADFKRALSTPSQARSEHFAVHFVRVDREQSEQAMPGRLQNSHATELSTETVTVISHPVDERSDCTRLGAVVPKRFARRAATRNLLKRQIRNVFALHHAKLPIGLWVLRLKASFVDGIPDSAQSVALRRSACAELNVLMSKLAKRTES